MRGAVLAGGAASRYAGHPKGLNRVGGERILDRLVASLTVATGEAPVLIANSPDAAKWAPGLRVVADPRPDCGSLGGIYTALTVAEGPVLLVAWDMPFVTTDLLQALVAGAVDCDVFLPESGGPRGIEPLCGVYGPACVAPVAHQLDNEDFRAIGFHDAVRVGHLPLDEVSQFGDPETLFFNVNTPDDLAKAEDLWRKRASSQ
jgi:molybdopterin-guanine dinucleotide biosynthesis protein A